MCVFRWQTILTRVSPPSQKTIYNFKLVVGHWPSVLWCCWLGGRKDIRPVKNWAVGCWRGYLSGARCRLAYAQLMPLPLTVSCFSKIQIGFIFLVPAHPGSPGKRAVKLVCVCVVGHTTKQMKHGHSCDSEIWWPSWLKMSHSGCTLVWHFQPRVHHISMSNNYRASSV